MTQDDILNRTRQVIAKQFSVAADTITRDTVAMDVSGWDSVAHVHLMLAIEREFGVRIPDERTFSLDNVGDLVDILADQLSRR